MMPASDFRHAWRLDDLLAGTLAAGSAGDRQVSALTLDSRAVRPGTLFCACQGPRTHGLTFADEAARRGAAAILAETTDDWPLEAMALLQARIGCPVLALDGLPARISAIADRFHGEPSAHMTLFGVIGSDDRASLVHQLAQALGEELPCAVLSGLGYGLPGDIQSATDPAPNAAEIQSALGWLRAKGARAVAMEVTSGTRHRSRVDAVRFSHAIFADGCRDHPNDPHGGDADVRAERSHFAVAGLKWAVINLDDPGHTRILADLAPGIRVAAFGLDPRTPIPGRCDLWARAGAVRTQPQGLHLEFQTSLGSGQLDAALIGTSNVGNLLAVLAVLLSRGASLERALRDLAQVRGVPGRMECFGGNGAPLVVVDYAHTPDALENALTNLRLHWSQRVITVVGCRGDLDRGERPLMGAIAERLSDALILTDDNPGSEDGDQIIADVLGGLSHPDAVRVQRQRGLAIRLAIALAGIGDAVLVAGKGHETTQNMGELKVHFSDRAQVVEALREWREGHH